LVFGSSLVFYITTNALVLLQQLQQQQKQQRMCTMYIQVMHIDIKHDKLTESAESVCFSLQYDESSLQLLASRLDERNRLGDRITLPDTKVNR